MLQVQVFGAEHVPFVGLLQFERREQSFTVQLGPEYPVLQVQMFLPEQTPLLLQLATSVQSKFAQFDPE